jgi:hypothetical protein
MGKDAPPVKGLVLARACLHFDVTTRQRRRRRKGRKLSANSILLTVTRRTTIALPPSSSHIALFMSGIGVIPLCEPLPPSP